MAQCAIIASPLAWVAVAVTEKRCIIFALAGRLQIYPWHCLLPRGSGRCDPNVESGWELGRRNNGESISGNTI